MLADVLLHHFADRFAGGKAAFEGKLPLLVGPVTFDQSVWLRVNFQLGESHRLSFFAYIEMGLPGHSKVVGLYSEAY